MNRALAILQRALFLAAWLGIRSSVAKGDVILDWNALMIDAIRSDNSAPTLSTRNLAILHTAMYDAINSIRKTHQPYQFALDADADASLEAAAVAAGYEVMLDLYSPFQGTTQAYYSQWLNQAPQTQATRSGLAVGKLIAELTLESRSSDGSSTDFPYIPSSLPGQWRRTPPFFRPPVTPQWGFVTPFCVDSVESFMPPPPPSLQSRAYADALNEVKAIGSANSTVRTAEQSEIAVFWSDFSYTAMPPGHWHLIAADIARRQKTSLTDNARLFALLSLAQADAAIVCWEAKYRHNFWRPVTAIQRANEDNNPLTIADLDWVHFLNAPPFPGYTSGHSTFSKASAQVLRHYYGTDSITFTAGSDSLPGVVRHFTSLSDCADEVGMSRIYGGIHFSFDNTEGKRTGKAIGDHVSANFLLGNDVLPALRIELLGDGTPRIRVQGHAGAMLHLDTSRDLHTWDPLDSRPQVAGGWTLDDASASKSGRRFYRVRE